MLEYAVERDCSLVQIGGLLDQKGYGIGLPKGLFYLSFSIFSLFKIVIGSGKLVKPMRKGNPRLSLPRDHLAGHPAAAGEDGAHGAEG